MMSKVRIGSTTIIVEVSGPDPQVAAARGHRWAGRLSSGGAGSVRITVVWAGRLSIVRVGR